LALQPALRSYGIHQALAHALGFVPGWPAGAKGFKKEKKKEPKKPMIPSPIVVPEKHISSDEENNQWPDNTPPAFEDFAIHPLRPHNKTLLNTPQTPQQGSFFEMRNKVEKASTANFQPIDDYPATEEYSTTGRYPITQSHEQTGYDDFENTEGTGIGNIKGSIHPGYDDYNDLLDADYPTNSRSVLQQQALRANTAAEHNNFNLESVEESLPDVEYLKPVELKRDDGTPSLWMYDSDKDAGKKHPTSPYSQ
jgi:hypothetical protein